MERKKIEGRKERGEGRGKEGRKKAKIPFKYSCLPFFFFSTLVLYLEVFETFSKFQRY